MCIFLYRTDVVICENGSFHCDWANVHGTVGLIKNVAALRAQAKRINSIFRDIYEFANHCCDNNLNTYVISFSLDNWRGHLRRVGSYMPSPHRADALSDAFV